MNPILVVDDVAIYRELIERVLRDEGFPVVTASNGLAAMASVSMHHPSLLILDLGLNQADGLGVLRHLRAHIATKGVPVIILSVETDRAHVVEAVHLGISGYLLKSRCSLVALLGHVRKVLEHAHQLPPRPSTAVSSHSARGADVGGDTAAASGVASTHAVPQGDSRASGHGSIQGSRPPRVQHADAHSSVTMGDIKSLRPLITRTELLERMSVDGELRGFSPTISQVLKLTASDSCSMEQVSKAVSQDHALALKMLRLANSSVYSRGERVDTVQKAVLRIGMQNIRQTVLNIGVVERLGSAAFEKFLTMPQFWEHSVACGIIAADLAHELKHKDPDTAFTAGLLHDLGRVLYAERLGKTYIEVLNTARTWRLPLEQLESRLLLINHAEVMDRVLHTWRFPKELIQPIVHHHVAPEEAKAIAPHQTAEVLRLGLADRLTHALMLGASGNDMLYPTEAHCRLLGVEASTIGRIEENARTQTEDLKLALLSRTNGESWQRPVEQVREVLGVAFRPLYLSTSPEFDAYRIFCKELAGTAGQSTPNIAVVHITTAKDMLSILPALPDAESDAGVHRLPVIVLSPDGRFSLDAQASAGRRVVSIHTPVFVPELLDAIRDLVSANGERLAA